MSRSMYEPGVVTLFPKTVFDFSFLAIGATQSIVVARALPIPAWYYLWLGVRVHNLDITTTGTNSPGFAVEVYQTLPSDEDPKEFTRSTADMTALVPAGSPPLINPVTANNLGPYLKVVVKATMGNSTKGNLYAELSAAFMGRAS